LPRYLKNVQNETIKRFSVGNTKVNILALTAGSKNKIRLSSDNFEKLGGSATQHLPRNGSVVKLHGNPTVGPRLNVWTRGQNGKSSTKDGAPDRLRCGTFQEEVSQVRQRVSESAARRNILYCIGKKTIEGCDFTASTFRRLYVVCGPRPSLERWAEMAGQLLQGVRPSGRSLSSS